MTLEEHQTLTSLCQSDKWHGLQNILSYLKTITPDPAIPPKSEDLPGIPVKQPESEKVPIPGEKPRNTDPFRRVVSESEDINPDDIPF